MGRTFGRAYNYIDFESGVDVVAMGLLCAMN